MGGFEGLTIVSLWERCFGVRMGWKSHVENVSTELNWWWMIPLVEISAAAFVPAAAPLQLNMNYTIASYTDCNHPTSVEEKRN